LLYLGEIYRTLSDVTLKKNVECGSEVKCNTDSAVCNLYITGSRLTRNKMLHSSHISVVSPLNIGHFLHITECRTLRHQNLETKFSYIFQFTIYYQVQASFHTTQSTAIRFNGFFLIRISTVQHSDIMKVFIHQRMHKRLSLKQYYKNLM